MVTSSVSSLEKSFAGLSSAERACVPDIIRIRTEHSVKTVRFCPLFRPLSISMVTFPLSRYSYFIIEGFSRFAPQSENICRAGQQIGHRET